MKKATLFIFYIFLANSFTAQVSLNSLEALLHYADDHTVVIQSARLQECIAASQHTQSRSFLYPSINAVAGYTDNITIQPTLVPAKLFNPTAPEGTFEEMTFGKQHLYNTGLIVQWDILNFQRLFAAQAAKVQKNASVLNTEVVRYSLYNQLANTFYSILLTRYSIGIYAENVRLTDTLVTSSREKYGKGLISESELNTVLIRHLQNEKLLELNSNQLQQFLIQLQVQLGTSEELDVSGDLESLLIDRTTIRSVSPEVQWEEAQVSLYEALLKQNKALILPSISLNYQYNHNWAADAFFNFSTANRLPSQVLGVKLAMPLFNGFSSRSKSDEMKIRLRIQNDRLSQVKLETAKEDEMLTIQFNQTRDLLDKSKQILRLQETNDSYAGSKYESGLISLEERMNKYNDLLSAQSDYLRSLADFSLAQYQLYIRQMDFYQPSK